MTISEAHGWRPAGFAIDGLAGARVEIAQLVDPRRRCGCTGHGECHREATQEDLLCDYCRPGHG